jgi:hypothetical protein
MKSKFFLLLLIGCTIQSFSQNLSALQTASKKYYQAHFLMDFETVLLFSHPKIVESSGRDIVTDLLEAKYENKEYRLREQLETLPMQMGTIKKIGEASFCVVRFRNPLRYFFENTLTDAQAAEKKIWLQKETQSKDVTFEPKRNSFNVRRQTVYVAVLDASTMGEWKFFNLDDAFQRDIFDILFGKEVKKQLGL